MVVITQRKHKLGHDEINRRWALLHCIQKWICVIIAEVATSQLRSSQNETYSSRNLDLPQTIPDSQCPWSVYCHRHQQSLKNIAANDKCNLWGTVIECTRSLAHISPNPKMTCAIPSHSMPRVRNRSLVPLRFPAGLRKAFCVIKLFHCRVSSTSQKISFCKCQGLSHRTPPYSSKSHKRWRDSPKYCHPPTDRGRGRLPARDAPQ